jgi:predicted nuclease of predicted toxin-antitoxin system
VICVLLNQGLPRSAALLLRSQNWDVVHVGELGLADAADNDILARALVENRIVCTLEADFHALLALSGASAPSVIRIRCEGLTAPALAELLQRAWPKLAAAVDRGALVVLTKYAVRVHHLPIEGSKGRSLERN